MEVRNDPCAMIHVDIKIAIFIKVVICGNHFLSYYGVYYLLSRHTGKCIDTRFLLLPSQSIPF
jgi:hypothetical protein